MPIRKNKDFYFYQILLCLAGWKFSTIAFDFAVLQSDGTYDSKSPEDASKQKQLKF